MLVFWGKQRVEKKEGFFVDLCPVCRKFTPYQLYRISLATSLYGRARSEGEPRGHEGQCLECGTRIDVDPGDYRSFYEIPGNSISNLIRDTFPTIRKARARRLQQERALREGTLRGEEREQMLMEPFQIFEEAVRRIFRQRGRWFSVTALLMVTACVTTMIWLVSEQKVMLTPWQKQVLNPTGPAVVVFGVVLVLSWLSAMYGLMVTRRPFTQQILPSLVKALEPLRPTRQEISQCLEELRRSGKVIGKRVKPGMLGKVMR